MRYLFFLLLLSLNTAFSQQGSRIEILKANEIRGFTGEKVNKLIGDVGFKQDDVFLYCDSALFFDAKNAVKAYGHVHIQQGDSMNVYGDSLYYDGNTRIALLQSHVKLYDKTMVLETDKLDYDMNTSMGSYTTGGKITDKNNVLTSMKGYYYSNKKEFFFREHVSLTNPEYLMVCDTLKYNTRNKISYFFGPTTITSKENLIYCENGWYNTNTEISQFKQNSYIISKEHKLSGDSLFYNRKKGIGKAFQHVALYDTIQKVLITGDYGINFRKNDLSIITGHALLTKIFEKDSLFLHSDTLKSVFDSTANERLVHAFHMVKIFKPDLRGFCDSLTYSSKDSLIRLYTDPIIWSQKDQLTADFITLQMANSKVDRMYLYNNSFIISQEDSIHFNQIKGKNMIGYFKDNELNRIKVIGNGQTVYYGRDKDNELMGVNKADCSDFWIFLQKSRIDKITMLTKPTATFYPMEEVNLKDLILKGFVWKINLQPKSKEDIMK